MASLMGCSNTKDLANATYDEDEQEEVDAVARTALHLMPNSSFSMAFDFLKFNFVQLMQTFRRQNSAVFAGLHSCETCFIKPLKVQNCKRGD